MRNLFGKVACRNAGRRLRQFASDGGPLSSEKPVRFDYLPAQGLKSAPRVIGPAPFGTGFPSRAMRKPDALFKRAKSSAAEQGIPLRELITIALAEKLRVEAVTEKPWLKSFGKLRGLSKETVRVNRLIDEEFGQIEPEDLR